MRCLRHIIVKNNVLIKFLLNIFLHFYLILQQLDDFFIKFQKLNINLALVIKNLFLFQFFFHILFLLLFMIKLTLFHKVYHIFLKKFTILKIFRIFSIQENYIELNSLYYLIIFYKQMILLFIKIFLKKLNQSFIIIF